MRDRRAHELIDGGVVGDLLIDHDAAVAVVGVFAQAHVGDDEHVRQFALDRADRRLNRRLGIVRGRADVVLLVRQAEEQHALDAVLHRRRRFANGLVDRQVEHARHRRTSRRTPSPSQTNSGSTNMSGDSRVSRTSARIASERRSRRSRRVTPRLACV